MRYCPTSVSIYPPFQPEIDEMGYAPYASVSTYPPLQPKIYRIWDIAPCPCLSIPFSNHEIWIWDRPPARRGCSRRYRMWYIAPRQYLSIPLSSPKYRIWDMPRRFSTFFGFCDFSRFFDFSVFFFSPLFNFSGLALFGTFRDFSTFRLFSPNCQNKTFDFSAFRAIFAFLRLNPSTAFRNHRGRGYY